MAAFASPCLVGGRCAKRVRSRAGSTRGSKDNDDGWKSTGPHVHRRLLMMFSRNCGRGPSGNYRRGFLNWRLVSMPPWVRDYVMIHELMHLRRMDHSKKFWKLVAQACPDYEAARQW